MNEQQAWNPIRIFIGADERQPVALTTLHDSIVWRSSRTVAVTVLRTSQLPVKRRGLTDFTFTRFLVPWLCNYQGIGVFMDADILVTGDIAELVECSSIFDDVQVMQDQPRFEWPSVMLFNNTRCKALTPEFIENPANNLFDLKWARSIGKLPKEWNACVGYTDVPGAKLYHFTQGVPVWPETKGNFDEDALWLRQHRHANATVPWKDLMGNSVHAEQTLKRQALRTLDSRVEFVSNAHN